jgi:hypothetical protein
MPILWSSIYIECPTPEQIDLVRMWLYRAGTCPLDLCLRDWLDSSNFRCSRHFWITFLSFPYMRYVLTINPLSPRPTLMSWLGCQCRVFPTICVIIALRNLEVSHFNRSHNPIQFLHHLYAPATRDLWHFDLYPLQSGTYEPDMLAKHPSRCVRECILAMENDRCTRVLDLNSFPLLNADCADHDGIEIEWDLSLEYDGMTAAHHHLAQLCFDDQVSAWNIYALLSSNLIHYV